MEIVNSRHILFLVGMHRSGTSALCAALHACGASFGGDLLEPMERVNERGFWEAKEVVALNERLLGLVGAQWYSVTSQHLQLNGAGPQFEAERLEAREVLQRGFGSGPLEVVKDPRFCITLPFWLSVCRDMGLQASVCVIFRAPLEVCQSLQERDGFPPGYGIRLLRTYLRGIVTSVPPGTLYASYDRLLEDPVGLLRQLEVELPLFVSEDQLTSAVLGKMKHQYAGRNEILPALRDYNNIDFRALDSQIEALYPIEQTLSDMASNLVYRGRELTRIGEAHARALQTLGNRDAGLEEQRRELVHASETVRVLEKERGTTEQRLQEIGHLHSRALATVNERDGQIRDFDQRLQEIGELHTRALHIIEERETQKFDLEEKLNKIERSYCEMTEVLKESEAHLQRILKKPGVGFIFRAMWDYEKR